MDDEDINWYKPSKPSKTNKESVLVILYKQRQNRDVPFLFYCRMVWYHSNTKNMKNESDLNNE